MFICEFLHTTQNSEYNEIRSSLLIKNSSLIISGTSNNHRSQGKSLHPVHVVPLL